MTRATKVISLVILGSALALIGWSCYNRAAEEKGSGHAGGGRRGGFFFFSPWFWGGRGGYSGGSGVTPSGSRPGTGGITTRGGFGGSGVGGAVGG